MSPRQPMTKPKQSASRAKPKRRPAARRTCVLVLGMHRSGTSALTRTLSLLGCRLPQRLMGMAEGNDTGHWEPYRLVAYNDQFLQGLHSSWHDWRPLDLTALSFERKAEVKKDILKIVDDDYGDAELFVVKDPRICRFPTFFMEAIEGAGIDVRPVLIFRNPLEVFASLEARTAFWPEGFTLADGALLWLSHVLEAERSTRGHRRTLFTYDALLSDWRRVVSKIEKDTGVHFSATSDEVAPLVDEFLSSGLRHHSRSAGDLAIDPTLRGWCSEAFEALIKLTANPHAAEPQKTLDRIYFEFRRALPILDSLLMTVRNHTQSTIETERELRRQSGEQLTEQNRKAEELAARLSDVEAALQAARAEIDTLNASEHAQLADRGGEGHGDGQLLSDVRGQLGIDPGDNRPLDQLVHLLIARLRQSDDDLRTARSQANEAAAEAAAKDEHIARFERASEDNANLLSATQAELEKLQLRASELQSQLEDQRRHAAEREAALETLLSENGALESELEEAKGQGEALATVQADTVAALEQLQSEKSGLQEKFDQFRGQMRAFAQTQAKLAELKEQTDRLASERDAYQAQADAVDRERNEARAEEQRLHDVLDAVYRSTSWRLTAPVRAIGSLPRAARNGVSRSARSIWHNFPLPTRAKQGFKSAAFKSLPVVFRGTNAYKAWRNFNDQPANAVASSGIEVVRDAHSAAPATGYVPLLPVAPPASKPVRVVAFYLPQFHPIPENDEWWGTGFTEWTNVRPARPQFAGHYQPHVPGELGYYDLRDSSVQRRQIELAKLYGIEGFCFYFYWFGGKRLLEKPLENWLADKSLDLPFCLCWANENWSRRWDGLDREILIAQDHSPEDDLAFIAEAAPYLRDPRYIRIDGKPLLLVYRPSLLPSARETAQRWRQWCRENDVGEIFLAYTQSFENVDPSLYGFDAAIEFPPNNSAPPNVTDTVTPLNEDFSANVYDWSCFPERSEKYAERKYPLFRSVCPSWDNTARRKSGAGIFINNTPALYRRWLENAIRDTVTHVKNPQERLVFVNAWNEWAEGAHLEPDAANGYAYLQETRNALEATGGKTARSPLLIVTHDCHPHGAQFLLLAMAREYVKDGFSVWTLALGAGRLLDDFKAIGPTLDASTSSSEVSAFVNRARQSGASIAICNTVVSGSALPLLKAEGFKVLSLIHELPGVIRDMHQVENAKTVARQADLIVFAAELVRIGFLELTKAGLGRTMVLPQGLLRKNPWKTRRTEARRLIFEKHGLSADTKLIVSVAYLDHRKGPDLLVESAASVLQRHPEAVFVWIGHTDSHLESAVRATAERLGITDRFLLTGFDREPLAYYAAADVYALPSREDPFPNVVLETAEVGVPVVAFREATGAAEFIVERGGKLAEPFDTSDFAQRICELLENKTEARYPPVSSLRKYNLDLLRAIYYRPRVSVVVPNYNYAHHILERLETIIRQTYPVYEIIVLDDCSTDDSLAVIQSFAEEHFRFDVSIVQNNKNSGSVFRQWKKGTDLCGGDLIWIAEADDFADPRFLEELVGAFADPDIQIAYSQSRQVGGDGESLARDYLEYTKDISDEWTHDYIRSGKQEIASAMAVKNVIPNVSAVLFRKEALERAFSELGEDLFSLRIAGDWFVYLQILARGNIYFHSKVLNSHRRHSTSVTKAGIAEKHFEEVVRAQRKAAEMVSLSPSVTDKAARHLEHVRAYLGLADRERRA